MSRSILHCTNSFSSLSGGVGFALKLLCEQLDDFRHIIFALRDNQPPFPLQSAELRLFNRTGPFALSYSRELEAELLEYVLRNQHTIVHVHGLWSGLSHTVNVLRKRAPEIPYVVSPHGMLAPKALERRSIIKRAMRLMWEDAMLSGAKAVHCLTPMEERHVKQFAPGLKTFVQPHPVTFPFTEGDLRKQWQDRAKRAKELLYLGRIHETKGVTRIVEVLAARARAHRPVTFRLSIAGFGQPEDIATLQDQIASTSADIVFLGPTFGDAKQQLLLQSHGLILPSMTEGLPMTLMEGAAHGLPLFVTDECNIEWIHSEQAGTAVPYGQDTVETLIDDFDRAPISELAKMGLRAAASARKRYSSTLVAQAWRNLYTSLCSSQF